jgi:hypothetical protein
MIDMIQVENPKMPEHFVFIEHTVERGNLYFNAEHVRFDEAKQENVTHLTERIEPANFSAWWVAMTVGGWRPARRLVQ